MNSPNIFKIDPAIWENVTKDLVYLNSIGTRITAKFISDKYNVTRYEAERLCFALLNIDVIHNEVNKDINNRKYVSTIKELEERNKKLLHELEVSEKRVDYMLGIQNKKDHKYVTLEIKKDKKDVRDGTAFAILSDIHIEEKVESEVVNGLNEYNPEIAKKRVENFFTNTLKLVNKERQNLNIDTLVLALLGDNITGYIHEELRETNYMSPTEATMYIKDVLITGIKFLVENGNFKEIIIPCTKGNHGRTTLMKRFSSAYKNSYEWMMYHDMDNIFKLLASTNKKYSIVKFIIPKSELTYIKVYDKTIRFGHGDHFKYNSGVGGIAVPMQRWLNEINKQIHADMTFLGHWHNILLEPTFNCMMNGSIIGMSGFGASFGGANRPPQQIFTVLDNKRGFGIRAHVDVL